MSIEIINFRKVEKNTLQGFFTVRLTNIALEIRDCALHQKDIERWVGLPAKPYDKEDGSKAWSYIVNFYDKDRWNQFQKAVLEALDKYLVTVGKEPPEEAPPF